MSSQSDPLVGGHWSGSSPSLPTVLVVTSSPHGVRPTAALCSPRLYVGRLHQTLYLDNLPGVCEPEGPADTAARETMPLNSDMWPAFSPPPRAGHLTPHVGATRGQGGPQQEPQVCSCKAPIQQLATVVQSRGGRRTQAHTGLQHSGDSRRPGKCQNSSRNRPGQLPGRQPGRGQGQLLCAAPSDGSRAMAPWGRGHHPALRWPQWPLSPLCQNSDHKARTQSELGAIPASGLQTEASPDANA